MEWQSVLESVSYKLRGLCASNTKFKREDELMSYVWADQEIRQLLSLWLEERYKKREYKSCAKANTLKTLGNKQFQVKSYAQSIQWYTKSALHAPAGSDELPVAIANRSAALFYLQRYDDCIKDIELAIKLNYPKELCYKLYLRMAQCYLKLGKQNLVEDAVLKVRETINSCDKIRVLLKEHIEKRITEIMLGKSCVENDLKHNDSNDLLPLKPRVAFGENPEFLYASVGIDKKYNNEKGRYVVANRFIKQGEILFYEKPVSFVLLSHDESSKLCAHCCHLYEDVPVPCPTCLDTLYCGTKCLKDGWSSYHRWECPGNQIGFWKEIGIAHLALKVLLTCTTTTDKMKFNEMQKLVTNFDKLSTGNLVVYAVAAAMLTMYLLRYTDFFKVNNLRECFVEKFSDETSNINCDTLTDHGQHLYISSLLLRHILQLVSNGHAITMLHVMSDNEGTSIDQQDIVATGIYTSASMMNHSCDPNIINIFMDQYLIVRASKNIAIGEEVFNCYGPHYRQMSTPQRQDILKNQYCFTCDCKPCTSPSLQYFLERFSAIKCSECLGAMCNIDNSFRCLDCGAISTIDIHNKIKEANKLFNGAEVRIDSCERDKALGELEECLRIRKAVLYKYNDDITITLDLIGEVYASMGQWLKSISYLEDKIAAVTERFGSSSVELLTEFNKVINICVRCLQEETDLSTDSYNSVLGKMQRYSDQMVDIANFNCGLWNKVSQDIRRKREELCTSLAKHSNV